MQVDGPDLGASVMKRTRKGNQTAQGGGAESRDLRDNPCCLTASKLLDEPEAHKRASQYRTGEGVGRGYPCFAWRKLLSFERRVAACGGLSPTHW